LFLFNTILPDLVLWKVSHSVLQKALGWAYARY